MLPPPPPPTPPPDKINVNAIANPADDSIESLSSPTTLFSTDPSNIDSFLSQQCLPPALVDNRPKRKSNQQIASSPSRTKRPTRSFPHRAALRAVVRGVASASRRDVPHQAPRRVSPPSAAQSAFDNPLPPPLPLPPPPPPSSTTQIVRRSKPASLSTKSKNEKKGRSRTMLGLIPKTEFLHEFRPRFYTKTNLTPSQIDKDIKNKRKWMNAHFQWWGNQWQNTNDDVTGPRLRSSNEEIDNWVIDSAGINIETTNQRRLSRYCIEQLWLTEHKTKLLVLINVADDHGMCGGLGAAVDKEQCIDRATISGREYYRLKCTVTSSNTDKLAYGEQSGTYSREQFERDVGESRNGDFGVSFDGTNEKKLFNWYQIINSPTSLMFFGAPLTQSRSFDSLWPTVKSNDTLYARFACMYDEFEGDVEACQALYNSYLCRRVAIAETKLRQAEKSQKHYDGDLFRSKAVLTFLSKIESTCKKNLLSVFSDFKNHAEPIIPTSEMAALIEEAPTVFGETWKHLCDIRRVHPNRPSEEQQNVVKHHQVFFSTHQHGTNIKPTATNEPGLYLQCHKLLSGCW